MSNVATGRLYAAACAALFFISTTVVVRANLLPAWQQDLGITVTQLGYAVSAVFWGTVAGIPAGVLTTRFGEKKLLLLGLLLHALGILLVTFMQSYEVFFAGQLCNGLANGIVSAVCNPLVANLFTENKAKKISYFHTFYPLGAVVGGLGAYALDSAGIHWRWQTGLLLLPLLVYVGLLYTATNGNKTFPKPQVVGQNYLDMLKACFSPLFGVMLVCISLGMATEVLTIHWIKILLRDVNLPVILLFVLISISMTAGRFSGGKLAKLFAPQWLLGIAATITAVGLWWLARAQANEALIVAVVFGFGVSFFVPATYALTSLQLPKTGALGLTLLGGIGMVFTSLLSAQMGKAFDQITAAAQQQQALPLPHAEALAGRTLIGYLFYMPFVLIFVFMAVALFLQRRALKQKRNM